MTIQGVRRFFSLMGRLLRQPELRRRAHLLAGTLHDRKSALPPPFIEQLAQDALPRTHYAYGSYHAALQARALAIPRISVIEFGVAGGNGLVALEEAATEIEYLTGVGMDVYGFDTGGGMPPPTDYRDLPYVWRADLFKMDVPALEARLERAELVLGDVADSVARFCARDPAPVGFVSFDLDYYTSTVNALKLFEPGGAALLPRIFCYFDDIVGDDWEVHTEFAGVLLAIREFNERDVQRKCSPINGLRWKRPIWQPWNDQMYVLHSFGHPRYCDYINPKEAWDERTRLRT